MAEIEKTVYQGYRIGGRSDWRKKELFRTSDQLMSGVSSSAVMLCLDDINNPRASIIVLRISPEQAQVIFSTEERAVRLLNINKIDVDPEPEPEPVNIDNLQELMSQSTVTRTLAFIRTGNPAYTLINRDYELEPSGLYSRKFRTVEDYIPDGGYQKQVRVRAIFRVSDDDYAVKDGWRVVLKDGLWTVAEPRPHRLNT